MSNFKDFYSKIDKERKKNWMHRNDRFLKVDWKKLEMSYFSEFTFLKNVRCKHLWFWKNDFYCFKNKKYIEIKSIFLKTEQSIIPKIIYIEDYKIWENTDICLFIYDYLYNIKEILYVKTEKFNKIIEMKLFWKTFINRIIESEKCEIVTNYFLF